jgi:hypothetical protein
LLLGQDDEGRVSLEEIAKQASANTAAPKGSLDRAMTDDLDLEVRTWQRSDQDPPAASDATPVSCDSM